MLTRSDVLLKSLKARRDAEILEARLKGNTVQKASPDMLPDEENPATHASVDHLTDIFAESLAVGDEDNGGLFGNMLDEPSGPALEAEETNLNTTILVRSMPIPKQFSFAGNIPKQLLRTNLAKSSKQAVLNFARLSGGSRAARAGLEIRWSPKRRRVWRMDDIACEDMIEAENYVSTLALSELLESGELNGVNWRTLPPAYRNLWGELEVARKERDDGRKRLVWGTIRKVLEQKTGRDVPIVSERTSQAGETVPREKENETTPSYDRPSERLQVDLARRRASSAYQSMLQHRSQLPIASFREEIVRTLESSQIMVLSGETGCGKSTQLPSFILEDQLSKGRPCKIFVTEPRRISAISLAQRVSQELGDAPAAMGTNSSLVGYSIRLEAKIAATTRLAFVTNGIALRMLEGGSGGNSRSTAFDEVTHIIIDEVHERSIESDFLLIVIKSLIQQRKDLKVVLMSATLDTEKISNFFGGCPFLSVPGRTFPVQVNYLEDAVELSGWHIDESSQYAIRPRSMKSGAKQLEWNEDSTKADDEDDSDTETVGDPTKLPASPYSVRTVSTVNFLDSRQIPYDLIMRLLQKICFEDPEFSAFSQAVLIFMPGLAEIRRMNDMIQGHPAFGSGEFVIYPLHSTISSEGQSAVFDLPPPAMRKIVICE